MIDLARLTVDDFAALVGDRFTLAGGGAYELTQARAGAAAPGAPRPPFTLLFAGPPEPVREQGIQALTHPDLGTLELFLVPVGRDAAAVRYEAVFG